MIEMPAPKIHETIDLEVFGETFPEVHQWIDGSFNGKNGRIHWINRHYVMAILQHFDPEKFPDRERREKLIRVAKLHVMYDWAFYYHRVCLPLDRESVIRELRAQGIDVESELRETKLY
jgi:hypothetical protein